MHSNDDTTRRIETAVSRRAALLAAGVAAGGLGAIGVGNATAQDDAVTEARIYADDYHRNARFRVVSKPLDYVPEVQVQEGEAFLADLYWRGYETRIARYGNTRERVLFFPPTDAGVEQGRAYRTGEIRSTAELAEGIVTIGFRPADGGGGSDEGG